jgi:uncharacterized damage-inducible protein DinB
MSLSPSTQSPAAQWFADFQHEHDSTRKLLERYPDGKAEWQPHERSMKLGALANHVADIPSYGELLSKTDLDFATRTRRPHADSAQELVARHTASAQLLQSLLEKASVEDLDTECTVRVGDFVIMKAPRRILLRGFVLNHMIHHRGQLGVYLRLLDIKIPGMYGPSADEPMGS